MKPVKRIAVLGLAAVLGVVGSGPVWALSCLPPDVTDSYKTAAASEASYVVVHGHLRHDIRHVNQDSGDVNRPLEASFQARLSGNYLGKHGFTEAYALPVTVVLTCTAAWCGGLPKPGRVLAFVRQTQDGAQFLEIGPCGGTHFADPKPEHLQKIVACQMGKRCEREFP